MTAVVLVLALVWLPLTAGALIAGAAGGLTRRFRTRSCGL